MKIVLNTKSVDLVNYFLRASKLHSPLPADYDNRNVEIQASRVESGLFDSISDPSVDAYLIGIPSPYSQKGVDFIKKKNPYVPVVIFGPIRHLNEISGADIYLPWNLDVQKELYDLSDKTAIYKSFYDIAVWNIANYLRNFSKLHKLTTNMTKAIEFGQCKYDPTRRTLFFEGKEIKKLSAKEGGILEVLASNFGEVVKKEIILERVWHKSDYFSGRSMDVYVTHLRKLLQDNNMKMTIKNISGIGLILE